MDEVEELEAIIEGYGCLPVISSSTDESVPKKFMRPPGEVRLWLTNKLIAYFAIDQNIIGLGEQLSAFDPDISQRMSLSMLSLIARIMKVLFFQLTKLLVTNFISGQKKVNLR